MGKKIAASQHQQAEIHRIPFASKQLCGGPESQPEEILSHCLFPVIWDEIGNASQQIEVLYKPISQQNRYYSAAF